ncbi:MAG: tryptophan 2,3-dioxygenase family protein [Planctomycetes bacterium]|nr:tryptophan 2,3-dioxygenase family protein [Planctomycetota bacterium]
MALTYATYLKLGALLQLQEPRSKPAEHDEMLFIVIHQTYELWFKQILHEMEAVKRAFSENRLYDAIHTFKRVRTIMKTLVGQVDVLETMTPMSFTSFRDRLDTASGFQSVQFRELEFVLGYRRREMLKYVDKETGAEEILIRRLGERSVVDHFYDFLEHQGVAIPAALKNRDLSEPNAANRDVQRGLLGLYKSRGDLAILFELMTDFDEGLQEWRYRHVKLVERTIGKKHGTGGSLGVPFLKQSLFIPSFHDLWEIRHELE